MKTEIVKRIMGQLYPAMLLNPVTKRLSGTQSGILQRICFLSLLHGVQSKRGSIYCTPSEKYLAKAADIHRVTVSRNVCSNSLKMLLEKQRRRPVNGKWQTNIYKLSKLFWAIFGRIINRFRKSFNRVTPMLHVVTKRDNIYLKNGPKRNGPIRNNGPTAIDVIKLMEKLHPELV